MGFIKWLKNHGEKKSDSTSGLSLRDIIRSGSTTVTGIDVNWHNALEASVVCACVDVIARGVAQVPFRLMKKSDRNREYAEGNDLYWLITRGPNPYMSDYEFRYTIAQHAALTGNAFVWLNRVMGKIKEMYPILPQNVTVLDDDRVKDGWKKRYIVTLNNHTSIEIPHEDMWVIKWRPFDGLFGLDPVRLARESIGLSMAGEKMASAIYSNGTSINGYLTSEARLNDEAREILRSEWAKNYSGTSNAGSIAVLSGNLQYHQIQQMSAQEAQLIDNRNFQISEICRMFGVQPIMVYHYLNATTYASVEQMFLSHIVHTMTPWYRLIESSANKHLLTDSEFRRGYYFKFFEQGMLRGDMTAMANWFKNNIEMGIMSPNDCRELLDMNPYDDGDIYLVPLNMATPKQVEEQGELNKKKTLNDIDVANRTAKLAEKTQADNVKIQKEQTQVQKEAAQTQSEQSQQNQNNSSASNNNDSSSSEDGGSSQKEKTKKRSGSNE